MGYQWFRRPINAPGGIVAAAASISSTELAATLDLSAKTVTVDPRYTVTTASTGSNISGSGIYLCNNSTSTAAGFTVTYNMAAPTAGDQVCLIVSSFSTSTATDNVKVKLSSTGAVKFVDGTNYVATFTALGETLEMRAVSATRWAVTAYSPSSTGASLGTS